MSLRKLLLLVVTHLSMGAAGFALGIYALPILIAPPSPSDSDVQKLSSAATFSGEFRRDLEGSDRLHWGEGEVSISNEYIALLGKVAPGPDYKLYLSPEYVETEAEVERLKSSMAYVGDVKTFENFMVVVGPQIDVSQFTTVVVWCETFREFISSAQYRE